MNSNSSSTVEFKTLFGLKPSQIRKNCILAPFLSKNMLKDFGIADLCKGVLYGAGNASHLNLTLIRTGIGASLTGDAVLYLKETACENLILLGACGLVQEIRDLKIGSLVSPRQSFAYESFSSVLFSKFDRGTPSYPDRALLAEFLKNCEGENIQEVSCATFGSLKLEEKYKNYFVKNGIEALDMECSAFFHAAKAIRRKAFALLYATDVIGEKPLFSPASAEHKSSVLKTVKKAGSLLSSFLTES